MLLARAKFRRQYAFSLAPAEIGTVVIPNADFQLSQFGIGSVIMGMLNWSAIDPADPSTNNSMGGQVLSAMIDTAGILDTVAGGVAYTVQNGAFVTVDWAGSAVAGHDDDYISFLLTNTEVGNVLQHVCVDLSIAVCPAGSFVAPTLV